MYPLRRREECKDEVVRKAEDQVAQVVGLRRVLEGVGVGRVVHLVVHVLELVLHRDQGCVTHEYGHGHKDAAYMRLRLRGGSLLLHEQLVAWQDAAAHERVEVGPDADHRAFGAMSVCTQSVMSCVVVLRPARVVCRRCRRRRGRQRRAELEALLSDS